MRRDCSQDRAQGAPLLATLSNVVGVLSQIVLWNLFAGQEVKRWQSARISDMHSRLWLKALRKDRPEQAA